MWLFFALLSALFAALTSILAKLGIDGVNSNLATAIRTVVVVVMAWGMVFLTHAQNGIFRLEEKAGFSHPVRPCHRRLLALLLPCITAGRRLKSCSCG